MARVNEVNQLLWEDVSLKSRFVRFIRVAAIQRILGHEKRTTTEIYLHSIGDMEREAINTFERVREKSHTDNQQQKEGQPDGWLTPL
jgi:hypothetical protein